MYLCRERCGYTPSELAFGCLFLTRNVLTIQVLCVCEGSFGKGVELSDKNPGSDIQVREWNSMASLCEESEKWS